MFHFLNHLWLKKNSQAIGGMIAMIGASMSEPHIDELNMKKSVCMYVCEFDTNFTYSDSDPLEQKLSYIDRSLLRLTAIFMYIRDYYCSIMLAPTMVSTFA